MSVVRLQLGEIVYPPSCACCMRPATVDLTIQKEDLKRLALAAVVALDAGGAAASLRRTGGTRVPYCTDCSRHIRWARMGGWAGVALSSMVGAVFGAIAGAGIVGVLNVFGIRWYLERTDLAHQMLLGGGAVVGAAIALSDVRLWRRGGPQGEHARAKDAARIVRLARDWMDVEFFNETFARAVVEANPSSACPTAK